MWRVFEKTFSAQFTNIQRSFFLGTSILCPDSIPHFCDCRKTDQYCKACSLLTKRNPILEITDRSSLTTSQTVGPCSSLVEDDCLLQRPQSSSSCNKDPAASGHASVPTDVKEWILAAYNEHHFRRSLTSYDLGYLGIKLGIRGLTMQSSTYTSFFAFV